MQQIRLLLKQEMKNNMNGARGLKKMRGLIFKLARGAKRSDFVDMEGERGHP